MLARDWAVAAEPGPMWDTSHVLSVPLEDRTHQTPAKNHQAVCCLHVIS